MSANNKPITILSVDDEKDMEDLIRQKFRRKIRKKLYSFYFANDGGEALEVLKEHNDIDFVLSDINMPGMDGLTFLGKVKELNRPALKVVMVTAYGDMDNLRTAMNNGAFDFVNKPINFDDLEITMNKTIEQVRQIKDSLAEKNKLISIQKDLDIAKEIQMSLIPQVFPPFPDRKEVDIFASMDAAKYVGGDLYDFFFIDDDRLGFVLGDVSGKGVPAAIFMAVSRTIIRTTALKKLPANKVMEESNDLICQESLNQMFVTVFYGILNVKTGEFEYSNGGHCPPYKVTEGGEVILLKKTGNMVLGIMDGMPYHIKKVQLDPGDEVFIFSDGVPEAMNMKNELYSEARLEKVLSTVHGIEISEISNKVVTDVKQYAGDAEQSDDITILTFRYNGK